MGNVNFLQDQLLLKHERVDNGFWVTVPRVTTGETTIEVVEERAAPVSPWEEYQLVAHFAGNLEDASPNKRDGDATSPAFTNGIVGSAVSLETQNNAVRYPDFPGIQVPMNGHLSISLWLWFEENQTNQFMNVLNLKYQNCFGYQLRFADTNFLAQYEISEMCPEGELASDSRFSMPAGEWVYVGVEVDGVARTSRVIFNTTVDGKNWETNGWNGEPADDETEFNLGGVNSSSVFRGRVDELRLSTKPRTMEWHALQREQITKPNVVVVVPM